MEYQIIKYPDNTSYVKVLTDPWWEHNNKLIFRLNSYEDLWHLNQLLDVLKSIKPNRTYTITIPNLIDAQADRRFDKNQSSGLKLVCEFLNGMDAKFKIFHPHNPEVVEALMGDKVEIMDNSTFIKIVLSNLYFDKHGDKRGDNHFSIDHILDEKIPDNLILMSSDAGGFKPLMKLCDNIGWEGETFSASKARKWEGNESKLVQLVDRDDFGGKDVLIVDDICIYGGTFKGLAKLLRERNVGKLYLAVSHMTVQSHHENHHLFTAFDKVFTTNSKYDYYRCDVDNLKIINLF